MSDFNAQVIAEFRANRGHVGGELADTSVLLLHHLGARSRARRVAPLAYNRLRDGRLVIVASNGGAPAHPAWYHNLKANPAVVVEMDGETFAARVNELDGAARDAVWAELIAAAPAVAAYQAQTARRIPVLVVTPSACSRPRAIPGSVPKSLARERPTSR
jgi:deazaflavin-dependent oxidoreductase (nitroreductase family)